MQLRLTMKLSIDAGNSIDAESNCGDEIISYEWDLDGDGLQQ